MQIPKIVYYLLFSLFLLVLMFDTYVFFSSIGNFREALNQALDAAIVAGVDDPESQHGELFVNYDEAYGAAVECLKKNLKLDERLANQFYSDSQFILEVKSASGSPFLNEKMSSGLFEGKFTTRIHLLCLKILGQGTLPYSISKTQDIVSSYI